MRGAREEGRSEKQGEWVLRGFIVFGVPCLVSHLVCVCRYDEAVREVLCRLAQERAFTMSLRLEPEHRVDAVVAVGVAQEESARDDPVVARGQDNAATFKRC